MIKEKDEESIFVFIPVAKEKVEVERKKETDDIKGRPQRQRKVQDGHQKAGKRTQGGSRDHCPLEALKSSGPKGSTWKEITKALCEMGLLIKERMATWHKSCKESQKREEDLLV